MPALVMEAVRKVYRSGDEELVALDHADLEVGDEEMVSWVRGLGTDFQDMVDKWDRLGIVVDRGASGSPFFVEVERDGKVLGP